MVTVEIDIAADGTITATPSPVVVPSGEQLMFHIRSNASERSKFTVHFPGGPKSPFSVFENGFSTTFNATVCSGAGALVNWPPSVDRATVTVSAHNSPPNGEFELLVLAAPAARRPEVLQRSYIIQNFYFSGDEPH